MTTYIIAVTVWALFIPVVIRVHGCIGRYPNSKIPKGEIPVISVLIWPVSIPILTIFFAGELVNDNRPY